MTSSTSQRQSIDTSTVQVANTVPAKVVKSGFVIRNSTTPVEIKPRSVPSSRIEGRAMLRYAPKEPTICETSTEV